MLKVAVGASACASDLPKTARQTRYIRRRADSGRVVVVTVGSAFTAKWLAPRLARFVERHPEIDLRIGANLNTVDLTTDQADVAVRYNLGDNGGLVANKLVDEAATPMCRPEVLDGDPPLREPADLARHTLTRANIRKLKPGERIAAEGVAVLR